MRVVTKGRFLGTVCFRRHSLKRRVGGVGRRTAFLISEEFTGKLAMHVILSKH